MIMPELFVFIMVALSIGLVGAAVLLLAFDAKLSKRAQSPLEPVVLPGRERS